MNCPHCRGQLSVVKPCCDFCREPFLHDQQVQIVPPISVIQQGQKSGQPILIPTDDRWDLLHLWCAQEYHNPEMNGGAEELREMIREDVLAEELESLKEAARAEIAEEMGLVCADCLDEIDLENLSQEARLELWQKAYGLIGQLQRYFPQQS